MDIAEFGRLTSAPAPGPPTDPPQPPSEPPPGAVESDPVRTESAWAPREPDDLPTWYDQDTPRYQSPAKSEYGDSAGTGDSAPVGDGGAAAMTGPVGKQRSPVAVVLLSILTLGLYTIVWHGKVNREMSDFHFGLDVHPRRTAIAIGFAWFLGLAVTLVGAARVAVHFAHISLSFDPQITATQAAFLLPAVLAAPILYVLLPFSLVAAVMTIERVRLVEAHSGLPTDQQLRPASLVWALLIPLAGGPLVLAREQSRLNATWVRAASRATAPGWGYDYGR